MPNWLVSRVMSSVAKANDNENAQCGRDRKKNGTCEDAERGNVKKENTKKDHEDAGNKNARRRIGRWQGDARAKLPKKQEGLLLSPDDASAR